MDEQNNIIEKEFLSGSIKSFAQVRNKTMRTRHQKSNGLVFSCMVIDNTSDIAEGDVSMSSIASLPNEPMDCDFQNNSFQLNFPEDGEKYNESANNNIMVKFENRNNSTDMTILDSDKAETLQTILMRFANKVECELSELDFFNTDTEPIDKSQLNCAIEELITCDGKDYIEIFYDVTEKSPEKCSSTEQLRIQDSTPIATDDNQETDNNQHTLVFEDRLNEKSKIDLSFTGEQPLSAAIEQIVDVMELDKSHAHFFNSKGTCCRLKKKIVFIA